MKFPILALAAILGFTACKGDQPVDCTPPPVNVGLMIVDSAGNNLMPASGVTFFPMNGSTSGSNVEIRTDSTGKRYGILPIFENWPNNYDNFIIRLSGTDNDTISVAQVLADGECGTYEISSFKYNGVNTTIDSAHISTHAFYRLRKALKK